MLRRITLVALLIATSFSVLAQYDNPRHERSASPSGSRDGRFEGSVILAFQNGVDESFEGGSTLDIDSSAGWGITFGWNWTAKLNLQYKLISSSPGYIATIVPEDAIAAPADIEEDMSKYSHQLNLTYNFSSKAFTPFVLAGIGMTKLDSNITTGPPSLGCWWDPWWGYICFQDWETYNTTKFAYNLGLGLRWDFNNMVYTKASYSREFISLKNGSMNFDIAVFELGMMF
jgi:opacity protein-like surface antigen